MRDRVLQSVDVPPHYILPSMPGPIENPYLRRWCIRCGYDLRGAEGEGKCPECGKLYEANAFVWQSKIKISRGQRIALEIVGSLGGMLVVLLFYGVGCCAAVVAREAPRSAAKFLTDGLGAASLCSMPVVALVLGIIFLPWLVRRTSREIVTVEESGIRHRQLTTSGTRTVFHPWETIASVEGRFIGLFCIIWTKTSDAQSPTIATDPQVSEILAAGDRSSALKLTARSSEIRLTRFFHNRADLEAFISLVRQRMAASRGNGAAR